MAAVYWWRAAGSSIRSAALEKRRELATRGVGGSLKDPLRIDAACRALRISSAQWVSSGSTSTTRFRLSVAQWATSGQRQNCSPAGLSHDGTGKPSGAALPAAHSRTASRERFVRCAMSSGGDRRCRYPWMWLRNPAVARTGPTSAGSTR
jgi:hypothetical protein